MPTTQTIDFAYVAARATALDPRARLVGAKLREPVPGVLTVQVEVRFRDTVAASLFADEMLDRVGPDAPIYSVGLGRSCQVDLEVRR